MAPDFIGALAGMFLLLGLWTPMAGVVMAVAELYVAVQDGHEPLISIVLATLGATLSMIGPGAWSVDARMFGRKHIETHLSSKSGIHRPD